VRAFFATIVAIVIGGFAAPGAIAGDGLQELRICLDTGPNHLRNLAVRQFAELLEAALPGRFHIRIFDSGQLYNDRDATKALIWGDMELALPTVIQLARFEPAANITSLPMFYGLSPRVLDPVLDETVGPALAGRIEARLPVVVLSPNLDLGYVHVFSTNRSIRSVHDLAGLKVRVFGGAANLKRLKAQGANPVVIPWADTPLALSQGNIDAIASSFETLQSASLWDAGIEHGFEDRGMFIQYVPLVRRSFWAGLDPATQATFARTWREAMSNARVFSASRQEEARKKALEHGVTLTTPDPQAITSERARLRELQDGMVSELRIPPEIVRLAEEAILAALSRQGDDDE